MRLRIELSREFIEFIKYFGCPIASSSFRQLKGTVSLSLFVSSLSYPDG
jgi:hypothetical protein